MNGYSADELIRILKACKSAGVTELKIGETLVKFDGSEMPQVKRAKRDGKPLTETELKSAAVETNIKDNIEAAEDRLDLLQIEDPAHYERLMIEGELGDKRAVEETQH